MLMTMTMTMTLRNDNDANDDDNDADDSENLALSTTTCPRNCGRGSPTVFSCWSNMIMMIMLMTIMMNKRDDDYDDDHNYDVHANAKSCYPEKHRQSLLGVDQMVRRTDRQWPSE